MQGQRAVQDPGLPGLPLDRDLGQGARLPGLQDDGRKRIQGEELPGLGGDADLVDDYRHGELVRDADVANNLGRGYPAVGVTFLHSSTRSLSLLLETEVGAAFVDLEGAPQHLGVVGQRHLELTVLGFDHNFPRVDAFFAHHGG